MLTWKVKYDSTYSRVELGYLKDYQVASIETTYDSKNRTVTQVAVRFFIDQDEIVFEAPYWYVEPEYSCEIYQHKLKKHHQTKNRFDNFTNGDYTECHQWVQERLDDFLKKAGLVHEVLGENEGC